MNIIEIHETLNALYLKANDTLEYLEENNIESQMGYFSGNYIKIGGEYALQAYPIPVITIKGKGDIGFNLDGMFFEFMLKKQTAQRLDIEKISSEYAIEVYGATDCEVDYYKEGMSSDAYRKGIDKSKENGFGFAFYFDASLEEPSEISVQFEKCRDVFLK